MTLCSFSFYRLWAMGAHPLPIAHRPEYFCKRLRYADFFWHSCCILLEGKSKRRVGDRPLAEGLPCLGLKKEDLPCLVSCAPRIIGYGCWFYYPLSCLENRRWLRQRLIFTGYTAGRSGIRGPYRPARLLLRSGYPQRVPIRSFGQT